MAAMHRQSCQRISFLQLLKCAILRWKYIGVMSEIVDFRIKIFRIYGLCMTAHLLINASMFANFVRRHLLSHPTADVMSAPTLVSGRLFANSAKKRFLNFLIYRGMSVCTLVIVIHLRVRSATNSFQVKLTYRSTKPFMWGAALSSSCGLACSEGWHFDFCALKMIYELLLIFQSEIMHLKKLKQMIAYYAASNNKMVAVCKFYKLSWNPSLWRGRFASMKKVPV